MIARGSIKQLDRHREVNLQKPAITKQSKHSSHPSSSSFYKSGSFLQDNPLFTHLGNKILMLSKVLKKKARKKCHHIKPLDDAPTSYLAQIIHLLKQVYVNLNKSEIQENYAMDCFLRHINNPLTQNRTQLNLLLTEAVVEKLTNGNIPNLNGLSSKFYRAIIKEIRQLAHFYIQ